ncbi:MAG: hypothetical protein AAB534_01800 [Patescibacteria group bacterium]
MTKGEGGLLLLLVSVVGLFLVGLFKRETHVLDNLTFYEGETKNYWVTIIEEKKPTDRQFCSQWVCLKAKFSSENEASSIITRDNRNGRVKDHICIREYRPNSHGLAFEWYSNIGEADPGMHQISGSQLWFASEHLEIAVDKVHNSGHIVPNPPANWPGMEKFEK